MTSQPQASIAIPSKLQQAFALHQQGRLAEAETLYKSILREQPRHFDALHLLGLVETARKNSAAAVALIDRALAVHPGNVAALYNRGIALQDLKRHEDAVASYDRALALKPDLAEALFNRGNALRDLKRHEDAIASYDRALAVRPDYPEALYNRGGALRDLKRHEEAVASYDRALAAKPDYAEALHNRRNALRDLGRYEDVVASYDKALAAKPDLAEAFYNRGVALQGLKRHEDAIASYDSALAVKPEYPEALTNRGNVLSYLKRPEDALASYDRALRVSPDLAEALSNRGNALRELKRHEDALSSYDKALAVRPDLATVWTNRGNALSDLARHQEALDSHDRALKVTPDLAEALSNRGDALRELKRYEDALASCDRALAVKPDLAEAWTNRGNALNALARYQEALDSHDRALALKPEFVGALSNRGVALRDLLRHEEAMTCYDRALAITPDHVQALDNRGGTLFELKQYEDAAKSFARLLTFQPDYKYALGAVLHSQLHSCDWSQYSETAQRIAAAVRDGRPADKPFSFLAVSPSAAEQLKCALLWTADRYPAAEPPLWIGQRYQHGKIRVAYLSADFYNHATAHLMAELFETHDQQRFEITAVYFGHDVKDAMRERLQRSFQRFVNVRTESDRAVARMLRESETDIAIDLKGYTKDSRPGILAYRPAPIQVNYLGYPGTLGADYIDYILADSHLIPSGREACYAEKIVRLPDTYQVNSYKHQIGARMPSRADVGLPDAGFVFCCFNNNYKITPDVFRIWMRLLRKVEGSVIWLFESNAAASSNLRREAEESGVASERLVFAPRMHFEEHLARHGLADLFLDTLPVNAHTTASDALWAGLPVLTCMGDAFAARVAGSLLSAAGLPELVTDNLADYEALALKLATAPAILAEIRTRLQNNLMTCALFDTDRIRRHIESAYITMWERYQRGEPPETFSVQPIGNP